jgi:hypothetical protein
VTATLEDSSGNQVTSASTTAEFEEGEGTEIRAVNTPGWYIDNLQVTRRTREYLTETDNGTTELGNEVTPSGGIHTGPHEAELDGPTPHAHYRTDPSLAGGSDVSVVEDYAGTDAGMRGQADGNGFGYGWRSQAALGRVARLNANLSWEYETLADVPTWSSADGGTSVWTFNVNGRPRRIHVEHDGSGGSDDFGGVYPDVLTTFESLDTLRVTFQDVSYTENGAAGSNRARLAVSDQTPDVNVAITGNGFTLRGPDSNDSYLISVVNGGSTTNGTGFDIDWNMMGPRFVCCWMGS